MAMKEKPDRKKCSYLNDGNYESKDLFVFSWNVNRNDVFVKKQICVSASNLIPWVAVRILQSNNLLV